MEAFVILLVLGALLLLIVAIAGTACTSAPPPRRSPQEEMRQIEMEAKRQIQAVSDESLRQFAEGLQQHQMADTEVHNA